MRTTLQIDDHLLQSLKEQAHREGISLSKLVNRLLQSGLTAMQGTVQAAARLPREDDPHGCAQGAAGQGVGRCGRD